jgi:hypothetical protein
LIANHAPILVASPSIAVSIRGACRTSAFTLPSFEAATSA